MSITSKISRIILAVCEAVIGIVNMVQYFRAAPETAALEHKLARGLLMALAGLFCIFNNGWFIAAFPLLTVVYGVITLITGIAKIQWTVDMIRMKTEKWFWLGINAALTIVCAVIILCNPFSSSAVLWVFVAAALIAEAVMDLLAAIFMRKAAE